MKSQWCNAFIFWTVSLSLYLCQTAQNVDSAMKYDILRGMYLGIIVTYTGDPFQYICRRRTWRWDPGDGTLWDGTWTAPIPNRIRSRTLCAAEKQLTAEKQPITEKLCMTRPSVLHTGNSSSYLSSLVPNGLSLVSHAWLSGDPMETGALCSSSSKKDFGVAWILDYPLRLF